MNILIACEESQAVCIEFRKLGFNAFSCDILPCSGGHPEWHIQADMLPLLKMALESSGISVGKPFFVRYCRVYTAREIGPLLKAKVVCVLIGERPGLITDESMSAYLAYKPHPDMSESDYTVVSNISKIGMPPVEAAAYISEVIKKMLAQKAGGLALKL